MQIKTNTQKNTNLIALPILKFVLFEIDKRYNCVYLYCNKSSKMSIFEQKMMFKQNTSPANFIQSKQQEE